jgi:hypothetical protein
MARPISSIQCNPNHHGTLRVIFTSADSFTTFHHLFAVAIEASISPACTFSPQTKPEYLEAGPLLPARRASSELYQHRHQHCITHHRYRRHTHGRCSHQPCLKSSNPPSSSLSALSPGANAQHQSPPQSFPPTRPPHWVHPAHPIQLSIDPSSRSTDRPT